MAYDLLVAEHNTKMQTFLGHAQVYRDRLAGRTQELEQYRLYLEGKQIISTLNQQDIENFKTLIEALVAEDSLYRSHLEAVRILLEQDKLTLQNLESRVNIYETKQKAKALEYQGYRDALDGEYKKAQTYESLASVFKTEVDAVIGVGNIAIEKQKADISAGDTIARIFATEMQAFATESGQRIAETTAGVDVATSVNSSNTQVYVADVTAESSRVDAEASISRIGAQNQIAHYQALVAQAETKARIVIESIKSLVEALASAGQIGASLASGALSSINFGMSQGFSGSIDHKQSISASQSAGVDERWTHNLDE